MLALVSIEIALFVAISVVGAFTTWRFTEGPLRVFTLIALLVTLVVGFTRATTERLTKHAEPVALRPADSGAVGSGACRSCHPSEHASWHRSFHRTMTQVATPASVKAPFDGAELTSDGHAYRLTHDEDG